MLQVVFYPKVIKALEQIAKNTTPPQNRELESAVIKLMCALNDDWHAMPLEGAVVCAVLGFESLTELRKHAKAEKLI